jgi:hypothetical protein
MPTDRYTRFVLTLIAAALILIAARPLLVPSNARASNSEPTCGSDAFPHAHRQPRALLRDLPFHPDFLGLDLFERVGDHLNLHLDW